ncbi:MAG: EAL domain-containing protein [Brevinematia bacterium]
MQKKLSISVLYVEDEVLIRLEISNMLSQVVEELYTAEDGEEALKIFKEKRIDVVITDVRMPKMDGLELSREIRKINPEIPIIITTAYSDAEYLLESLEIGVNQYLIKPIQFEKIITSLHNLYEVKTLNKKLEETRSILIEYKNAIDLIAVVFKTDPEGIIQYANEEFCRVTDTCKEDIIGKNISEVMKLEISEFDLEKIKRNNIEKKVWKSTIEIKSGKDDSHYINFIAMPIADTDTGMPLEYIFIGNDITDSVKKEQALLKQLYTDNLTQLPNRLSLINDLSQKNYSYLCIINIDSFREINDFYGVIIGDYILKEIAERLKSYEAEKKYRTYKLSSDEYAVLITGDITESEALSTAEFIRNLITENKFNYEDNTIYISVTIGMASLESGDENKSYITPPQNILLKADMALKKAKSLKKSLLMYDESFKIFQEFQNNIVWTKKLKDAISSDRIVPYYQPIVNNTTGKIEKFETLVRLISESGEPISPVYFLNISKRNRLYEYITKSIFDRVAGDFSSLSYDVSMNISIEDIQNPETKNFLIKRIRENKEFAKKLVIELTETEEIGNFELVNDFINELKENNVKVAIDDFGSGYSNFDHIIKFNVDYLKIDSSIIKNIPTHKNSQILTKFIVDFARTISIKTVAEFVASKEIYEKVVELGIDYSQGYFFSEPKPLSAFLEG